MRIFYSFCKKAKWEVFMPEDIIISTGQQINDIFVVFDGEVVVSDLARGSLQTIGPGSYFGGVVPNMVQLSDYKSKYDQYIIKVIC